MTTAVAALVVAIWLLGGHTHDELLGRAVRLWSGPGIAVALVTDGAAVAAVLVVGVALLAATVVTCARRRGGLSVETRRVLDLAEADSRLRLIRDLRDGRAGGAPWTTSTTTRPTLLPGSETWSPTTSGTQPTAQRSAATSSA